VYVEVVVVATENDSVYALNETSGQVEWHVNLGTPVPAGELPCGDISPTVGITSTPVIDPTNSEVFVVADTWDGTNASSIQHKTFALTLANGSVASGFPVVVDPPGSIPADLLQRSALALSGGKVFAGFGGNDGDCATYHGWLVGVPEAGGTPITFEVAPQQVGGGGAIWGGGDGPAVDASGDLWLETGNGFGSTYGYQESVLKLDTNLNLLDYWAPSNWPYLYANDIDLGSGNPLLLPDGLVFAIGKGGEGYLLSASHLGGEDAAPVYSAQVCGMTDDASFGGAVYYDGVIYAACWEGLRALALDTSTQTFTPLSAWQVISSAIGPPIVAGGLVWVTNWNTQQLFGPDPETGQARPRPVRCLSRFCPRQHEGCSHAANHGLVVSLGSKREGRQ
jgi:outer membrane protein assembly factor BamB